VIYSLLEKIPSMFENTRSSRNALGSAVKAAQLLLVRLYLLGCCALRRLHVDEY
jgi:hypothetical protein